MSPVFRKFIPPLPYFHDVCANLVADFVLNMFWPIGTRFKGIGCALRVTRAMSVNIDIREEGVRPTFKTRRMSVYLSDTGIIIIISSSTTTTSINTTSIITIIMIYVIIVYLISILIIIISINIIITTRTSLSSRRRT